MKQILEALTATGIPCSTGDVLPGHCAVKGAAKYIELWDRFELDFVRLYFDADGKFLQIETFA